MRYLLLKNFSLKWYKFEKVLGCSYFYLVVFPSISLSYAICDTHKISTNFCFHLKWPKISAIFCDYLFWMFNFFFVPIDKQKCSAFPSEKKEKIRERQSVEWRHNEWRHQTFNQIVTWEKKRLKKVPIELNLNWFLISFFFPFSALVVYCLSNLLNRIIIF